MLMHMDADATPGINSYIVGCKSSELILMGGKGLYELIVT